MVGLGAKRAAEWCKSAVLVASSCHSFAHACPASLWLSCMGPPPALPSAVPPVFHLVGMLQLSGGSDIVLGYAAAGAIAAYLRLYISPQGPQQSSSGAGSSAARSVPPPADLLSTPKLAAVQRMLKYHPGGDAPALEKVDGVPTRWVTEEW